MNCSNCEALVNPAEVLVVSRFGSTPVAVICGQCESGVLTMKIVLSRSTDKREFSFEGYLPVSSVK